MCLFLKATWGVFLKCRENQVKWQLRKNYIEYQKSCLPGEFIFSPFLFYFYSMTEFLVLFLIAKGEKKRIPALKRSRPRPLVVSDLFVFLIGWKLCNKLDDDVNLLYCIVFFSFCNKIFLNNKWGVSCLRILHWIDLLRCLGHGCGLMQILCDVGKLQVLH